MKHCSTCGRPVEQRIPAGDDRPRHTCTACGAIHYLNPRVVVGCLVEHEQKLLLCKRAIEPNIGRWTVPGGYLELGEGALQGARRETREEAQAEVEITAPHAYLDLPHIGQCYYLFHARLRSAFAPGPESLEVELVALEDIPWTELAFPVVHWALELFVADRSDGVFRMHQGMLHWDGTGSRFDPGHYTLRDHLALTYQEDLP
jgi:ADP-ribose/FAD diphosphatase